MHNKYPKFKRGEIEEYYEKLPKTEKDIINDYLEYRTARGVTSKGKLADIRRYMLHVRYIVDKGYKTLTLKDIISLLAIINHSDLSDHVKNNLKIDLRNFLKYLFKDWSDRFNNLDDVKTHSSYRNEEKINSHNILKKEDIEKCMKHETRMFYKAFLMTQYEAGLRTGEARGILWDKVKFNVDGDISEIEIFSPKTKRSRTVFVKAATFYLKKLKEEQHNTGVKSVYVFPSKDPNVQVHKNTISEWFRTLTQKALGSKKWNYLLRHSRATELYELAEEGKVSKDTAIRFMGHSEDMSKVYTHLSNTKIKKMLKDQVYKIEDLPEEKQHELYGRIEGLEKQLKEQEKKFMDMLNNIREELMKKKEKQPLRKMH